VNAQWTYAVAIVTGGSCGTGRDVAFSLASRGSAIVVVYLERQWDAEATVAELLAAGATTVAVRADLADELDVERLFSESIAIFGGVDLVVHSTRDSALLLYRHAARNLRQGGAIVSIATEEPMAAVVARELRERGIAAATVAPGAVLSLLDGWRRRPGG
jgi:3-oxoacyl-[acyl-carrier protein] reductase